MKNEIWIGLIYVVEKPGSNLLAGASGAYTNGLALAGNFEEYEARVMEELEEMGFEVKEIEDAEPLSIRKSKFQMDRALLLLGDEVQQTGEIRFSSFHSHDG